METMSGESNRKVRRDVMVAIYNAGITRQIESLLSIPERKEVDEAWRNSGNVPYGEILFEWLVGRRFDVEQQLLESCREMCDMLTQATNGVNHENPAAVLVRAAEAIKKATGEQLGPFC
jgi:hypothetical protein